MNNLITTIDQRELDPSVSTGDRDNYFVREAARAVLTDDSGRVALMYVAGLDYYKLPGGGVEEGEDVKLALARELMEEQEKVREQLEEKEERWMYLNELAEEFGL